MLRGLNAWRFGCCVFNNHLVPQQGVLTDLPLREQINCNEREEKVRNKHRRA